MERSIGWLLISARVLLAIVFLLNGFGVINQAIPAKEMIERGVPATIVPFAMFAGRFLEIVAGFGLALGIFPRSSAFLLFAFLVPATFVSHSFWLAAGTPQFQGQLINFCKNLAIWGGLVFIAAAANQPSLLPQNKTRSTRSDR
jgi:putative oxidoreductase